MTNSRRSAAFIVAAWLKTKEFPSNLLPSGPDRAFVQDLVYTVVRRLRPLRKILGLLVKSWPKGEMEALLYVGAAQILYMDSVADYAAVHETVEAAKACPNPSIARVVNGVLRNLLRRRDEFLSLLASAPVAERESYPEALWKRWAARYGAADAEKLAKWHNSPARTFLARPDGSFTALERGERVDSVPGFREGAFIVQDPATALAVSLLAPKEGEEILDACAAPGGKTIQLAWRGAKVTAAEVNPARRRRLEENLARVNLSIPVLPALPDSGAFAGVLVDAPCSNSGVLRRRPDARWNWSLDKLAALTRLQSEILSSAARLVAPGGRLVYSTCSNEPEENMERVSDFLSSRPDFTLGETRESVPYLTDMDGAFAAELKRIG